MTKPSWVAAIFSKKFMGSTYFVAICSSILGLLLLSPGLFFFDSIRQWDYAHGMLWGSHRLSSWTTQWSLSNSIIKIPFLIIPQLKFVGVGFYTFLQALGLNLSLAYFAESLKLNNRVRLIGFVAVLAMPIVFIYAFFNTSDVLVATGLALSMATLQRLKLGDVLTKRQWLIAAVGLLLTSAFRREGIVLGAVLIVIFLFQTRKTLKWHRKISALAVVLGLGFGPTVLEAGVIKVGHVRAMNTDTPALAVFLWRAGAINYLPAKYEQMVSMQNVPIPPECDDNGFACPVARKNLTKIAWDVPREDYYSAIYRRAIDNPGSILNAYWFGVQRNLGINYPMRDEELGVPAPYTKLLKSKLTYERTVTQNAVLDAKWWQEEIFGGFFCRPIFAVAALIAFAAFRRRNSNIALELLAVWGAYSAVAALYSVAPNYRYQVGFMFITWLMVSFQLFGFIAGKLPKEKAKGRN